MEPGEKFDAYLARLRVATNRCAFTGQALDDEVRNQCLADRCSKLQERLLQRAAERGDMLILQDVVSVASAKERTQALIEQMGGPSAAAEPVQLVAGYGRRQLMSFRCGKPGHRKAECPQQQQQQQNTQQHRKAGWAPVCFTCRSPGHMK